MSAPPARRIAVMIAVCVSLTATNGRAAENNPYLETIGALMASQLYTTYLYIGVTADAFAKDVYKAKQVRGMMNEIDGLLTNVAKYLKKVGQQKIIEADRQYINDSLNAIDLLKAQAKALVRFAGTNDDNDARVFDGARRSAYAQIAKLLGLPPDK